MSAAHPIAHLTYRSLQCVSSWLTCHYREQCERMQALDEIEEGSDTSIQPRKPRFGGFSLASKPHFRSLDSRCRCRSSSGILCWVDDRILLPNLFFHHTAPFAQAFQQPVPQPSFPSSDTVTGVDARSATSHASRRSNAHNSNCLTAKVGGIGFICGCSTAHRPSTAKPASGWQFRFHVLLMCRQSSGFLVAASKDEEKTARLLSPWRVG